MQLVSVRSGGGAAVAAAALSAAGGAAASSALAVPSLWGQTVRARTHGQPRVEAGSIARNDSDGNCDVSFFGADVLERGRVVALFKIVKSIDR